MAKIGDILDKDVKQQLLARAASQLNNIDESKLKLMRLRQAMVQLWSRMSELFGAKFVNQYGTADEPGFDTWCQVVGDLKPEQIQAGFIALCHDRPKFIPDALQFRDYCLGTHNLPDPHTAYVEACMAPKPKDRHTYSHPAVYYAGKATGWGYLASTIESTAYPRYKGFYEELLKRIAKGERLEMPVVERIEHKVDPSTPDSPAYQNFKNKMKDLLE